MTNSPVPTLLGVKVDFDDPGSASALSGGIGSGAIPPEGEFLS